VVKTWKRVEPINEIRTFAVTGSGGGLVLTLTKKFCETYGIISGDQIKCKMTEHLKRDWAKEEAECKRGD